MKATTLRQRSGFILLPLVMATATIGTSASSRAAEPDPAAACAKLATSANFPVTPTEITLASYNAAGAVQANGMALPAHCLVQGVIRKRIGSDGFPYGAGFEVRLPAPADWNGRFMLQGGGGTEGAVPPATGVAGTLSPTLAHGWAVASQNGGHDDKTLPNPMQFFLDSKAVDDYAYGSIDATAQTAKFLIDAFYGRHPDRSYFVGCSTGGRQGMVFSQNFPEYFDGIIAGDPVYDLEAIAMTELWGVQAIQSATPAPVEKLPNGNPILYPALPVADQELFTRAVLAACDALDGSADGVIDNAPACWAKFDPATFVFPSEQPLQCTGAKSAICLSPAQITAIKRINSGPRDAAGHPIKAPAGEAVRLGANATMFGYPYDGGFLAPTGIPARKIGTPTSTPGDLAQGLGQIPYHWILPADAKRGALSISFDKDIADLNKSSPVVSYSASTDISKYKARGGKIIWYHGVSDPGPPVLGTIEYYNNLVAQNGGLADTKAFARLFLVPNMGHCRGGPATDQFDMLTPLVEWVEKGVAPERVIASGQQFTSAPTTRSRPLCPYPQQTRYTGPAGGDLGSAGNYACVPPQ
jgi:pimeloyl-ACP methyl ester carboxylesterase